MLYDIRSIRPLEFPIINHIVDFLDAFCSAECKHLVAVFLIEHCASSTEEPNKLLVVLEVSHEGKDKGSEVAAPQGGD